MVFLGLQAMIDPPRPGVKEAIATCKRAGVSVMMVTGDHEATAKAIAHEIGIEGKSYMPSGDEPDFERLVEDVRIFARVNPEHKIHIVKALQKKGEIVAMTGDGVNDAAALKKANIGVAMGVAGTDVAKEASDMIITDDHFASIVNAVEEGRGIMDNIEKFVNYLLSSNAGEVLLLFVALLIGFEVGGKIVLPLLVLHLLWLNIVTDGLPAIALGVDPIDRRVMERKPREPSRPILDRGMIINIIIIAILMTIAVLAVFNEYLPQVVYAQTAAFTTMVFLELVRIYVIRAKYHVPVFSNPWLFGAIGLSLLLQISVIYTPLSGVFETTRLSMETWIMILSICAVLLVAGIIIQRIIAFLRHREHRRHVT
jgi:Ca2+-transporting ATPase